MTLYIIECDVLYEDLQDDYVSYGTMFKRYFQSVAPSLKVELLEHVSDQIKGELPCELPSPDNDHVYLITGSKFGAYEDHPWIKQLSSWVQRAFDQGCRLLGVCFGHQLLAQALGGKVENSHKGWGVGIRTLPLYTTAAYAWPALGESLSLIYSHQDQVTSLPRDAEPLLGDEFCPNAGFYINRQVLTLQGHPEFTPEYTRRLLHRRAHNIGLDRYDQAMASLDQANDNQLVCQFMLDWMGHAP